VGILSSIMDVLFPPRCVFCRKIAKSDGPSVRPDCRASLPFLTGKAAETKGDFFDVCFSPLRYEGSVRSAVHRFKFKNAVGYADCFGSLLADCIRENLAGQYDIISWVPLSETRRKKRGYDQAFLLAQAAALSLDDIAVELLVRHTDAAAQSSLTDRSERLANVMGVYAAPDPELIYDKRVLLTRTLLTAGARSVVCCALAKAGRV